MGNFLQDKVLTNYAAIERTLAGIGFVGVGIGLVQTNPQAGGTALLFTFIGYVLLIVVLPLLAFMDGPNPLNRARIKGLVFIAMAILCFAAVTTGVMTYLVAASFFIATGVLYILEPHFGRLVPEHEHIGASVEKEPIFDRASWKRNPISRSILFH